MAGQVVSDHPDVALAESVVLDLLLKPLVGGAVVGGGSHRDRSAVRNTKRAVAPGLVGAAEVLQRRFDPVAVGGPGGHGRERTWDQWKRFAWKRVRM